MIVRNFFKILVLVTVMCLPAISHAQQDPPDDPVDVPIDGGLSILLAAGVGYGVKKAYSSHKKKVKSELGNDVSNK